MNPEEWIETNRARSDEIALAALRHLWACLPFGATMLLPDGTPITYESFVEPKVSPDDHWRWPSTPIAAFDVKLPFGHLEFFIVKTGFGGAVKGEAIEMPESKP